MPATIEQEAPRSLAEINFAPRGPVFPSPGDWGDQALYFLLPDRFSDAFESSRPLFDRSDPARCAAPDHAAWMRAGNVYQGGTLKGIASKLDYLQRLGITTLWIGPIWKQRADQQSYHGYGVQNFLEIEPRLGTRQDLRDLVDAAHERGMHVLLDVVYNHTGDNWFYADEAGQPRETMNYRETGSYDFHGWRSRGGRSIERCEHPDDGVWPREFQDPDWYTRAGRIMRWDDPDREQSADAEFRRGDFFTLKDLNLEKSEVLEAVVKCYQYWIALSDCDGFRIDTCKHVPREISAIFCHDIRTFARGLGKKNFLLLGEVTGNTGFVRSYVDPTGPNLDCVLDIESAPARLSDMVKGLAPPTYFFDHFGGRDAMGQVRTIGRHHVSILDDHDMVWRTNKHRFSWNNSSADPVAQAAHVVGVQLTTPGIPCIYYGTEQCFDGSDAFHDDTIEPRDEAGRAPNADRYLRESMFGGTFGAFRTQGCHFFDPNHPAFRRMSALARLRNGNDPVGRALRGGNLVVREVCYDGECFQIPQQGQLVAWARLLEGRSVVMALNTHGNEPRRARVTVDRDIHPPGSHLKMLYRNDWPDEQLQDPPSDQVVEVQRTTDGRAFVEISLPPAGMAVLTQA